jgi:Txe/YoeB family toxin of Txe-Axe toxin-antitoxin module
MVEIICEETQRFKKILKNVKNHPFATREEIENVHRFYDTLAEIKQHTSATQLDMWELEEKIIKVSRETKYSINDLVENFLILEGVGYLKFP